jgi:hypothetical protein
MGSSDVSIRKTSVEEMSDTQFMPIAAGDDEEDEKEEVLQ